MFLPLVRAADAVAAPLVLLASFLIGNLGRMPAGFGEFLELRLTIKNLLLIVGFIVLWRFVVTMCRLYGEHPRRWPWEEGAHVLAATTGIAIVALIFPLISVTHAFTVLSVALFWIALTLCMLAVRVGLRALLATDPEESVSKVVVVGTGPRGQQLYRDLRADPLSGYDAIGFVDSIRPDPASPLLAPFLGTIEELESLLMRQRVDEVFITLPARSHYEAIQRAIEVCERGGVPVKYMTDIFRHRSNGGGGARSASIVTVASGPAADDPRLVVKRMLDIVGAALGLLAAAPVLLIAAVAIRLTSRGPVLFIQERYGLNKRRFWMLKLRTMVADAEQQQDSLEALNEANGPIFKIRADPRQTGVGRLLRRWSIDELPQLVNVLRGEMSLVGPRPLPVRDVSRFSDPAAMRRFSVRPGITCLWQINGRSSLGFDEWLSLDLEYIDRWSLGLDVWILARTLPAVIRGEGAT